MKEDLVSESEFLEEIKGLAKLPLTEYKNFTIPANVQSFFVLTIVDNNRINGVYFTIEPAYSYYFHSVYNAATMKYEIINTEPLNHELLFSLGGKNQK